MILLNLPTRGGCFWLKYLPLHIVELYPLFLYAAVIWTRFMTEDMAFNFEICSGLTNFTGVMIVRQIFYHSIATGVNLTDVLY